MSILIWNKNYAKSHMVIKYYLSIYFADIQNMGFNLTAHTAFYQKHHTLPAYILEEMEYSY